MATARDGLSFRLSQGGTDIAGARTESISVNSQLIDTTTKDSNFWRDILPDAGVRSVSISCEGVFDDATISETIRGYSLDNSINTFTLTLNSGDTYSGDFKITSYNRSGAHDSEETFDMTLESSGAITFAAA